MEVIKKVLKKILKNKFTIIMLMTISKYLNTKNNIINKFLFTIKFLLFRYTPRKSYIKGKQIRKVFEKEKIDIKNEGFIYNIDVFTVLPFENEVIGNNTIDYSMILNNSLNDLKRINDNLEDSEFKQNQKEVLIGIENLVNKEIKAIRKSKRIDKEKYVNYFENIINKKAMSFEEALQRILFYNQLLWQTGHTLNGLGRLDFILDNLYKEDIEKQIINEEKAQELLIEFCSTLHDKFYWYKSNSLIGDTGQIIILGGKNENGEYFENDLTYLFIKAVMKLQLPEPKVLLRVSKDTPRRLIELSLQCIKTGIGCPLFSNDEQVIEKLIEFGYDSKDAYNYVTSACWEPLIAGKSIDPNNAGSIIFLEPFNNMLENEKLEKIKDKQDLINIYKTYLKKYVDELVEKINKIKWEEDPLLSLFIDECNKKLKDISIGGAKYNNYGYTTVSLANTVNSIQVINELVFEKKKYTLEQLNEERKNNFENSSILNDIKNISKKYGSDENEIIAIANDITDFTKEILKNKKNSLGGKIKFGLSAPTYISDSVNFKASLDGRKNGEPFSVHISTEESKAYTELIQFASKLDYSDGRFNGNVVDFMVTPSFIEENFDKFVDFICISIKVGFFQMQMNVISSDILIKARNNPEEFPNLIVRVWGFSAYFNDLPDNYKDLLIERALKNEGKSY